MNKRKVPHYLYRSAQEANKDIAGYEQLERYALKMVLEAAKQDVAIDDIYIKSAQNALKRRVYNSSRQVA